MSQERKLRRSRSNRIIAGVCGGLGHFFGISTFWFRLAFLIALGISLGIGLGRLRFAWWPLHPVVFVFLGGYQATLMGVSFLIGWLIKIVVSRYGGARLYQRLKPLMIGIIAAEMVGALIPMLVGTVYYVIVGHQP